MTIFIITVLFYKRNRVNYYKQRVYNIFNKFNFHNYYKQRIYNLFN